MTWTVEILNDKVRKELEELPLDLRAKFLYIAEMLEEFGPQTVGEPFVKPLKFQKSGLWEMRMKSQSGIVRAVYISVKKQRIVVLHVFIKKTEKTPRNALTKAIKRLTEVKND